MRLSVLRQAAAVVSNLRDVAHRYKGFLFDLGCFRVDGSSRAPASEALRCARELVSHDKNVAVVHGTPLRASALRAVAQWDGVPEEVLAWSSGELIHRCFATSSVDVLGVGSGWAPSLLAPIVAGEGAVRKIPCVFEVGSLVHPRRWAEHVKRGPPPLSDLVDSGMVRRVDDLQDADVCFWDALDSDDLGDLLEATIELCAEYRVPILQATMSPTAASVVEPSLHSGSAAAAASTLSRLGGSSISVGKLACCLEGLGWDISPRDILVISKHVGDVCESAEQSMDCLLSFGPQARSVITACSEAHAQERAAARRHASVSQRMAEDSPAMLHAASNPFFSVFQLPALLVEVSRKNAEHRERQVRTNAVAGAPQAFRAESHTLENESNDPLELVKHWCDQRKMSEPVFLMSGLRWDDRQSRELQPSLKRAQVPHAAEVGDMPGERASGRVSGKLGSFKKTAPGGPPAQSGRDSKGHEPGESLDEVFNKLTNK